MCAKIEEKEDCKHIIVCTKTGLKEITTKVLIDCTGDANTVGLAGYELEKGEDFQPATYSCRLEGYDYSKLDLEKIAKNFDKEVEKGNFEYTDFSWTTDSFDPKWLQNYGANANRVYINGMTGQTSEEKSALSLKARITILKLLRFCREQEGLENIRLMYISPECGIRETVRIKGKKTVTQEDYLNGKRYGDDVCYSFYPIDLHTKATNGLRQIYLEEGIIPSIPRGALLPQNRILKWNDLPHIRFHDLRHSCASILLSRGFRLKDVQDWLGHSDITLTANIYGHLDIERKRSIADTMANIF